MNIQSNIGQASTFQQWSTFINVLNESKVSGQPLLKKTDSLSRIPVSLERQLPREQQPEIFRRLGKHTQLVLNFSQLS